MTANPLACPAGFGGVVPPGGMNASVIRARAVVELDQHAVQLVDPLLGVGLLLGVQLGGADERLAGLGRLVGPQQQVGVRGGLGGAAGGGGGRGGRTASTMVISIRRAGSRGRRAASFASFRAFW